MVGRFEEGLTHLEKALAAQPGLENEFNLARVLAANGRFRRRFRILSRRSSCPAAGTSSSRFSGRSLCGSGKHRGALETTGRALRIASDQQNAAAIEALKTRIAYYQSRMAEKK